MKIRKATKKDVKELAILSREYDKYENKLDKTHKVDTIRDNEKFIAKVIGHKIGVILVLEIEGKVKGMISGEFRETLMGKGGIIHHFIISEEYRNKGYGKKLLKELEKYFITKGCKSVQSFVLKGNKKVLKFYNKLKYSSDEEGFIIRKRLK